MLPLIVGKVKKIIQLLFPLKSPENHRFSDDFRGNRSQLISLNPLYIITGEARKFGEDT